MVAPRTIFKYFLAIQQEEGMGAQVRRSIGTINMRNFTPFLMLDHFNVSPQAGFPDHPHYGQSTVTYLLKGRFAHEDFTGAKGVLVPGDLQFMTAGKGIVHAEMPIDDGTGTYINGMQLWVDLPKDQKEIAPSYRDLKKDEIPVVKPDDKVTVKVIAGEAYGVKSVQDLAHVAVDYYDFEVLPGGVVSQPFKEGYNVFLYILEGSLDVGGKVVEQYNAVFFNRDGATVDVRVPETQEGKTQFVLIGGQALDQQIVQHGPFVATTREKIYEVFMNYQAGKNGFERAIGFVSSIARGIKEGDLTKFVGKKEAEKVSEVKDEL